MNHWRRLLVPAAFLLLPLVPTPARAQGHHALFTRDGADVWAVGDSGRYYRSFDGGGTWTFGTLGNRPLRGVAARGLRVVVVGDSGRIWVSDNSGGAWALTVAAGAPVLRGVELPSDSTGYAVGDGGAILKTTDAGATWSPLPSGTLARLDAVRFADATNGWVAGAGGFAARTTDGGASWMPRPPGTSNELTSVDVRGATVWLVGAYATAYRSTDGGAGWTPLDLRLDARADVRAVWLQSPDTVFIAGGGGFIRRSTDGGASWTFLQHAMHGQISDLCFVGPNGWASSSGNRVVIRTGDRGDSWSLPSGGTLTRSWGVKLAPGTPVRGSTIGANPMDRNTLFCLLGAQVWRSRDEGETWQAQGSPIAGATQTNAFVVSPRDSNLFLAATVFTAAPTRRIMRSTDGGTTWTQQLAHAFGEYGIPLEVHPDRPDTVFFGGDSDSLYRSTDFGITWSKWGNLAFRSPCDIVVVPDSGNIILVGDGITGAGPGQIYGSTDHGATWSLRWTNPGSGSEVPGMSCSRLRNSTIFATNWSSGGVVRTTDHGVTWPSVAGTSSAWGTDIARDDPNVAIYGVYSGSRSYLSLDGGSTFTSTVLSNANYSFYLRDRGLILAEQSSGVWKMSSTYAFTPGNGQSIAVTSPDGGEGWAAGATHAITWTAANVAVARIEYRRSPGDPWQQVADVTGYAGTYGWTVPADATTQAMIRVSDASDASPTDTSNAPFTIQMPVLAVVPDSLSFGPHPIGSSSGLALTLSNTGTGTLDVTSMAAATPRFHVGRAFLTLAPGASDSAGVWFEPTVSGSWSDTVSITSNAPADPLVRVPLRGSATDTLSLALLAPNGGEAWERGTVHAIRWASALVDSVALDWRAHAADPWDPIVAGTPAAAASYAWTVPNAPTGEARVRVRQVGGAAADAGDADFTITHAVLVLAPSDTLRFGDVEVGSAKDTLFQVANPGDAALAIGPVSCANPAFHAWRTGFDLAPAGSDTLGISYRPAGASADTATVDLVSNDAASPKAVVLIGRGVRTVGVQAARPTAFALWQNHPNPAVGGATIRYALPLRAPVALEVFDLQGERVATLVRATQEPGFYSVRFETVRAALASGVYFYRLQAGSFASTRKMLVVK
ncbi:MAG: choice-of-anchor D domain-containing protein [Candidatus Eisenbacteria bacterium]|nr:choice-of-anchor D domain-containing protein [Candidatus Eisenbacteria bacterium]